MRQSGFHGGFVRPFLTTLVVVSAVAAAVAAAPARAFTGGERAEAYVPAPLLSAARERPGATFDVIVQAAGENATDRVAAQVAALRLQVPGRAAGTMRRFSTVPGVAAEVTGAQLLALAARKDIVAVTEDAPVRRASLSSTQQWPFVSSVARFWPDVTNGTLQAPTIAVVDSGIDATRADFGGRVLTQVTMTNLQPNGPGDGRGHGTFVAGIAAGSARGYTGAAPNAKLVSLDVMDDSGMAMTSDVIAAADWIYRNRFSYNIRVANFALHTTAPASIFVDPLDRAVEKLWLSGVVVVAAAGNYGVDGLPSGVPFAPGNDPFVITVGANDISGSVSTNDDVAAPWSAYGYTIDGFAKPELAAPGRYMIAPVPVASTLTLERPGSIVAPGYMKLSGTSFAAAAVSGAAASILAVHPSWTPSQVKGALMLSAKETPSAMPMSLGVGEIDAARAAEVVDPPNPNLALERFLVPDPTGDPVPVFDAASWGSAAQNDPAWDAASWGSASWGSASWGSASWDSASWGSASWGSASWGSASWGSASWGSTAWADNSEADAASGEQYVLDALEQAQAEAELGISIGDDGTVSFATSAASSLLP